MECPLSNDPLALYTGCELHGQPYKIDGQPYRPMDYLDVGDYLSDGFGWRRVACARPEAPPQTSNHICLMLLYKQHTAYNTTLYNTIRAVQSVHHQMFIRQCKK